jgi:hypothetical protein
MGKSRSRSKSTPKPRPEKVEAPEAREPTSYIGRQRTRVAKVDRILGALSKDVARAPSPWGDKIRAGLAKANEGLTEILTGIGEAPDNYELPRLITSKKLEEGDVVQLADKYQPSYKGTFKGVEFGATAFGVVLSLDEEYPRAEVEFGKLPNAIRASIPTRQLVVIERAKKPDAEPEIVDEPDTSTETNENQES